MGRLSATAIPKLLKTAGRHYDGDCLYLKVEKPGRGSWVARVQSNGKRREFGLGSASLVSLSEAREACRARRKALHEGRDPLMLNRPPDGALKLFKDVALELVETKIPKAGQERAKRRLELHAFPKLGKLQLQSINADTIADCMRPIWLPKHETADTVLSLIKRTLLYGLPDGAALVGTLTRAVTLRLPPRPKGANFIALEYRRVPEVVEKVTNKAGMGALALRLAVLTATRSQEVRGARWGEVDLDQAIWTIPPGRMKMRREHRVPLSPEAVALFREAAAVRRANTDLVFASSRDGVLSDATLLKALRDADEASKAGKATVHGFRSAFTDWCAEQTSFDLKIADACLAHAAKDKVQAAYLRTTFFDKRRELMDLWGAFCTGSTGADIIQLHRA